MEAQPAAGWDPANLRAKSKYEIQRLPQKDRSSARRARGRSGAHVAPPDQAHILAEDVADRGACDIDKSIQGVKKWYRRRLGGIIAAVNGCRVVLDWQEHQFGEGTAQTYVVRAGVVAEIMKSASAGKGGKLPQMLFMDNSCARWRFACNEKRKNSTEVTQTLARFHYMLDIWHVGNHIACLKNPESARRLDPYHEENAHLRGTINTEACEQFFSFLDRVTYVAMNQGQGQFSVVLYLLFDLENEKTVRRRRAS